MPIEEYQKLKKKTEDALSKKYPSSKIYIQIGSATCENAAGAEGVAKEFLKHIQTSGRDDILVRHVGCTGQCSLEPIVTIFIFGKAPVVYQKVDREAVHEIFLSHIIGGKAVEKYLLYSPSSEKSSKGVLEFSFDEVYGSSPFWTSQKRIALRNTGMIDPESLFEYVQKKGFSSLAKILEEKNPDKVVETIVQSKLRGRGGAGFPTGTKWKFARQNEEKERYLICNADEGDPGAFMDRSMLESDPLSVIEGMIIAGFAIGAKKGFFYIRAEYPYAISRIEKAVAACLQEGLLGKNILGSDFSFDLEIRLGAGAFVCGEETAMIHSIQGSRGQPKIRPPFPAQEGLWKKPTIINNVETLANIPYILQEEGKEFNMIGTPKSGGTKVFAISGKVVHTGLVEVPMGTTLRKVIFDICGGVPEGKKLKAVQTGGPAGGCIPYSLIDTPIDYETLGEVGSIMGSGGMIVLDEDDCMVEVAKFFIAFSQDESCGKCSPCREGTLRMLEILERITNGEGVMEDLNKLARLGQLLQKASLCGLGRAAPNPVLSTLKYFRKEYEEHIIDRHCTAHRCQKLVRFEINPEKCVGCTVCAKNCPVTCISGVRRETHHIDQKRCIQCGRCFEVCRFGAVRRI